MRSSDIDSILTIPKKRDLSHCSDIRLIGNLTQDWLLPIPFSDYERHFFYVYSISCYMIVSNSLFLANFETNQEFLKPQSLKLHPPYLYKACSKYSNIFLIL